MLSLADAKALVGVRMEVHRQPLAQWGAAHHVALGPADQLVAMGSDSPRGGSRSLAPQMVSIQRAYSAAPSIALERARTSTTSSAAATPVAIAATTLSSESSTMKIAAPSLRTWRAARTMPMV